MTTAPGLRVLPAEATYDEAKLVRYLADAGVPDRFQASRFDNLVPRQGIRPAIETARSFREPALRIGGGLFYSGPPGTGKSHLAVAVMAELAGAWLGAFPRPSWEVHDATGAVTLVRRPKMDVRFVVVPSLLDELRAQIRVADGEDPLPALINADLVVLDDLGREKGSGWAHERLYVLVNERYNARRSTIVTTNYSANELADRGYDALVSRLREDAVYVRLEANDYRVTGAAR